MVDHDPVVMLKVDGFLDRKLPEDIFVTVDDLVVREDLWSSKDMRLQFDGNILDVKVPVLD